MFHKARKKASCKKTKNLHLVKELMLWKNMVSFWN